MVVKGNEQTKGLKKLNKPSKNWSNSGQANRLQDSGRKLTEQKRLSRVARDAIDRKFGFERYEEQAPRLGWLLNMKPTELADSEGKERSALDLYFLEQDGSTFKVTLYHEPYFYVSIVKQFLQDVSVLLQKRFSSQISKMSVLEKEDLDLNNHLAGIKARYVKLSFRNVSDLMTVRKELMPLIQRNKDRWKMKETYEQHVLTEQNEELPDDILETVIDIREYDVPYYVRVSIDLNVRVGSWYTIQVESENHLTLHLEKQMVDKADPRVFAFDIECTKAPLKFPDASVDSIFMISYMVDGKGYLILNREFVSEDIDDFEYTPKPEYPGSFQVFNEKNEFNLLRKFYDHILEIKPHIYVTYNGDFFDWPFVEKRSNLLGINMYEEIGIAADKATGEYRGVYAVHIDAFCWVKRDSYLPQGSQGLKAVTKYKLSYDPVEVDPENMLKLAQEAPYKMASYSVSDAVATFYLYEKYVHLFVFSLCTIIPMNAEDVLRKGSGTLCEALLMVEAFNCNIIAPNKENSTGSKYYKGYLLENETYVGGHVECLESGVFRSDIATKFRLVPEAFASLISNMDRDLTFALQIEHQVDVKDVVNYEEIKNEIIQQLEALRDQPNRTECPLIYHLDVAAMYPNIILTNRLQPCAIVNDSICASCIHNRNESECKRKMEWTWRGDFYPAKKNEIDVVIAQVKNDKINGVPFKELSLENQSKTIKQRIKSYCSRVYKKVKKSQEEKRVDTVCMRENPFYVNTVRAFRDRRYEYKGLTKEWKQKEMEAMKSDSTNVLEAVLARNKTLVYDSLQLAHKCILNSFYGYVMRKGARWHSMEMAGIVTCTGSGLITRARELIEKIGRPLELDTDGIWCILPKSFPVNFTFVLKNGKKKYISYPCVMMNADVNEVYTNHQYQDLIPGTNNTYKKRSECSIFFEVDGPYRCMLLPSSTDEGRLLKKRYAVFNMNGSLAELKGFELKRRGELQLIKAFQSQVFDKFLNGKDLKECYSSVAECGNHWLDVVDSKGEDMDDEELLELITENRNMSGRLSEYGSQKSTSITTARRLGEFLGEEVLKDKGLNCKMIISRKPAMSPVTDRAIPTAIFSAEPAVLKHFLRKWLKDPGMNDFDIRNILDWDYYRNRLAGTIQKIISLPAAFQNISNPVPRVPLPDWMRKRIQEKFNPYQQTKLKGFIPIEKSVDHTAHLIDMEDIGKENKAVKYSLNFGSPKDNNKENTENNNESNVIEIEDVTMEDEFQHINLSMGTDEDIFDKWLIQRKKNWKEKRLLSKRNHLEKVTNTTNNYFLIDSKGKKRKENIHDVTGFLEDASNNLNYNSWQILEVFQVESGIFKLWVMTSKTSLQQLLVKVPRRFIVNSRILQDASYGQRIQSTLPRGKKAFYLHEILMSEQQFSKNKKLIAELLSDPDIEGVYELKVPSLMRAIFHIGCMARVKASRRNRPATLKDPYVLEDLELISTKDQSYLSPDSASYKRIFLYYSYSNNTGLAAVFFFHGESASCQLWLANPFDSAIPNVSNLFSTISNSSSCKFNTNHVTSLSLALQGLNSSLSLYLSSHNGPTIILTQSVLSKVKLRSQVPVLDSFPLCFLHWHDSDSIYPTLQWQKKVCETMIKRYLQASNYWTELLECSRFSSIPIGNFSEDHARVMLDILYSRMLIQNKHTLWMSPTNKPDLGGMEMDENEIFADDIKVLQLNQSGSYNSICVELQLEGLAVNTLLITPQIDEYDGAVDNVVLSDGQEIFTQGVGCAHSALNSLRSIVLNLFKELSSTGSPIADFLLQHFYRWLCSSSSNSYDPALHKMLYKLMEKLFLQLLSEIRRLGGQIIHATFTKIIVCTKKKDIFAAKEYVRFLIDTIVSNELFQVLNIIPIQYWRNLLFLDSENYGGIHCSDEQNASINVVSHWNIANYLSDVVRDYFLIFVGQFLKRLAEFVQKQDMEEKPVSQNPLILEEAQEEEFCKYLRKLVSNYMTFKLLTIVPQIVESNLGEESFPKLPGSHLTMKNPALELVKMCCHILQLESSIKIEVEHMKKTLLKLLGRSPFDTDVICLDCNYCRDLDLCRDPDLLDEQQTEEEMWSCSRCHSMYNKSHIEMRLVDVAQQQSVKYQVQDLLCVKCSLPLEDNMSEFCQCSGTFECSKQIQESFKKTLKSLHNIAIYYKFSWLEESTRFLLEIK